MSTPTTSSRFPGPKPTRKIASPEKIVETHGKGMRSAFRRMDTLLKMRPEFADYMAKQQRLQKLREYDARIEALQKARALLKEAALGRPSKAELRSSEAFCAAHSWTEEDATFFVEDFQSRHPPTDRPIDKKKVASGMSSLASALLQS